MKKRFEVEMITRIDVTGVFTIDAEDEDMAHDISLDRSGAITKSIRDLIDLRLSEIKRNVDDLDDISHVVESGANIDSVKEIETSEDDE